nr:PREDICTED: 60S ribosomal protein L13a-2-like isoform X3 [Musa acuminata subsp. malaccensis]
MVSGSGLCARNSSNGQPVVAVCCEEICLSEGLVRQKMKYLRFLRKRMNSEPSHGPVHFRTPAKILWRTPSAGGAAALARLKAHEGVPPPYDKMKRMVISDALKYTACLVGCHLRLDGINMIPLRSDQIGVLKTCWTALRVCYWAQYMGISLMELQRA